MTWQQRLAALTLAGGTLLGACSSSPEVRPNTDLGVPVCNGNPDPCCNDPAPINPTGCAIKRACLASGYDWAEAYNVCLTDGGVRD
jgi:hypothetical protein